MADPFGFLKYQREDAPRLPVGEAHGDYRETYQMLAPDHLDHQARRCMDCGIPFCELYGCPAGNRIPDWITMVCSGKWRAALDLLHSTDNFPEITGRLCPAQCEAACVLGISFTPMTVRQIELQIAEHGWSEGWINPEPASYHTLKRIAVVGSGPAGLAAAQQLTRSGHTVTVFDCDDRIGGVLRYGIPDFALEKRVLDRRLDQLIGEGVGFETGVDVGVDMSFHYLQRTFDAVIVLTGSRIPKDIIIPGRSLGGVHFAMDFLRQQNRRVAGDSIPDGQAVSAAGKRVVVIGGGETGAYCIATCRRQGASDVVRIELKPASGPGLSTPKWPHVVGPGPESDPLAGSCTSRFGAKVERFMGNDGKVTGVVIKTPDGRSRAMHVETIGAELVILALGFEHLEQGPLVQKLSLETDESGNLKVDDRFMTSAEGVFAVGDCVLGGSPVVQAIAQGRRVAEAVNRYLV